MKTSLVLLSAFVSLFYLPRVQAQSLDKNTIEAKIDSLIPKQVNDSTPGLVVGVVRNGEVIFSKGYGLANLSYDIPNDPKMVYNIGSVSKQFLGYAFAMLHTEGELSIDDPVSKYLEDWPEFDQTVTLRHLLSHTSGYREAYTMSNLAGRYVGVDRLTRKECLDVVRRQPQLEFTPGSRYTYNSTAWVILAEVFEKIKGQPADEWVQTNILSPLGMRDTQIESYVGEVIKNTAESYSWDEEQGYTNQESNRAIFGAAEVYASIPDLAKWLNNLKTITVGNEKAQELFLNPFILNDGINSEYALGIGNSTHRGLKIYSHTGGHEAFSTQMRYYPEADLGIIVISNFGRRGYISSARIAELLLENQMKPEIGEEIKAIKVKKKKLELLTGLYIHTSMNRTMELSMKDDQLTIEGETILIPTADNTFGIEGWDGKIVFSTLADGNTQLTAKSKSANNVNIKAEPWTGTASDLAKYKGDYWSNELETTYHLIIKDEKLTINHRWIGEVSLEPISDDFFQMEWGFYVKFTRDAKGEISGLSINSGRTLDVLFEKK